MTADAPDAYASVRKGLTLMGPGVMMAQQMEVVQERLGAEAEPMWSEEEFLRRAGVSIPTMRDIAPFDPVPLRPRWLAFLCRLFRVG